MVPLAERSLAGTLSGKYASPLCSKRRGWITCMRSYWRRRRGSTGGGEYGKAEGKTLESLFTRFRTNDKHIINGSFTHHTDLTIN